MVLLHRGKCQWFWDLQLPRWEQPCKYLDKENNRHSNCSYQYKAGATPRYKKVICFIGNFIIFKTGILPTSNRIQTFSGPDKSQTLGRLVVWEEPIPEAQVSSSETVHPAGCSRPWKPYSPQHRDNLADRLSWVRNLPGFCLYFGESKLLPVTIQPSKGSIFPWEGATPIGSSP